MCLYSREHETRLIKVDEAGDIGPVTPHGNGSKTGVLPKTPEPGIACLCLGDGLVMRLSGLPEALANKLGLVSTTAIAVFREGEDYNRKDDRFEFDNGSIQTLNRKLHGCAVECLATSMDEYLASQAQPVVEAEPEANAVYAGVLTTMSRSGAVIGAVSLMAIVAVLFH